MGDANTRMSDEWLLDKMMENPCVLLESGNLRMPPCRLSFPHLFEKQKPMEPGGRSVYSATFLFHAFADIEVAKEQARIAAVAKWADYGKPTGPKLTSPFRDQAEKQKFDGYIPGSLFITATAERHVPIVDLRMVPIVEKDKVYPGCWVIPTVRVFTYDKKVNKGVAFGLQSLMVVADDIALGGGGGNPEADFAAVTGFDMDNKSSTAF